ncbi:hypothetical protein BR93DRAFT_941010 [Coniochaeta sp. PMI_546]|nr:hypothetical protein BR93DRAFT_941010 [Coniochaeta sp. PMI_546]
MYRTLLSLAAVAALSLIGNVQAKAVFAHYMVGTTTEDHIHQDIDNAKKIGLDGFALNIADQVPLSLLMQCLPCLATQHWRQQLPVPIYFIPDIDDTNGYYGSSDAWWYYWGNITDGIFSWETAWPVSSTRLGYGGYFAGDVAPDVQVIAAAKSHNNHGYMMGLSTIQYKNAYGANVYRAGELNMPRRMDNILKMAIQPDYIQVLTWNDFPESHNIGNSWPEQNTDIRPLVYGGQYNWPHTAWQGIHTSFIRTWKAGGKAADMRPIAQPVEGAMWYKTILQGAACGGSADKFYNKPDNFETGQDVINYALVVDPSAAGLVVRCYTDGQKLDVDHPLVAGLNYGSCSSIKAGTQRIKVVDGSGNVHFSANGVACTDLGCPQGFYNMNYQVTPVLPGDSNPACKDYQLGSFDSSGNFIPTHFNYDPAGPWRTVPCNLPSSTPIITIPGPADWDRSLADDAWNDFKYFESGASHDDTYKNYSFSRLCSGFFYGPTFFECGSLGNTDCSGTIACGVAHAVNGPPTTAAGGVILTGMVGIHNMYQALYDALFTASVSMIFNIGKFSETFAPVWDSSLSAEIGLDVVSTVFGVVSAPFWGKIFPELLITKDEVTNLVTNGIGIAKDTKASDIGLETLQTQNDITSFLGDTIQTMKNLTMVRLRNIFNGSDASMGELYKLIDHCAAIQGAQGVESARDAAVPLLEQALWVYMIPVAWKRSSKGDSWDPTKTGLSATLSHDDGIQNFVCSPSLEPYWISSVSTSRGLCVPPMANCLSVDFGTLPGISKLGGSGFESKWDGITRDQLVNNAVNAWKANGKKNGWAKTNAYDPKSVQDIINQGLNAPGLVNIPVCSFAEAYNNARQKIVTPNYPCT